MDAIDMLGPKLSALLALIAAAYILLSLVPILWPAFLARRAGPQMPRRALFVSVVAALVYGAFSFLAFAVILPVEVYRIFVAPQLAEAGVAHGAPALSVTGFIREYWWLLIPAAQLVLTWHITKHLMERWPHICAAPPNNSFKPKPLRGTA